MDVARREMAWEVDYLREAKNAQHFRCILIVNPLSPNISMQILLTVLHVFLMVLVGRICLRIKTFYL